MDEDCNYVSPHTAYHRFRVPKLLCAFFLATTRLVDGPSEEITHDIRRRAYKILIFGIRYGVLSDVPFSRISELVRRGMEHSDRAVRMEAGRACAAYVEACSGTSGGPDPTGALIDLMTTLMQAKDPRIVETTTTTLGKIGRVSENSMLGRVILLLIGHWDQRNSLLRGLAYIELRDLAQAQNKSSYTFLSPFFPDIIKYVTANICTKPALLRELGRFLAREPSELLAFTLSYSLPSLVATCSKDEIRALSQHVGRPAAALLIDKTSVILKAVFLLPDPASTDQALLFMTSVVKEAAGARADSVDPRSLVSSSIAELLAELVILLGSNESNNDALASEALRKVQRALSDPRITAQSTDPHALRDFLQPHLLAIMTYINEVLQEMQGKKTPAYKAMVIRSLGTLIGMIGSPVTAIAPQIMAAIHTNLLIPGLTEACLSTWKFFMTQLALRDIGPYIGPTAASFVTNWDHFSPLCKRIARETLEYLLVENAENVKSHLNNVVSLSDIAELRDCATRLEQMTSGRDATSKLDNFLERCLSENITISSLSLVELKQYLTDNDMLIRHLASGDHFDSAISTIIKVLFNLASRDGDVFDELRLVAFECIGLLGALDPFRFETPTESPPMIVLNNFDEGEEAKTFALYLIQHLLVDAFRSTSDLRYQSHLAFAIQELLKFCEFTSALIKNEKSVQVKTRARWKTLPVHLLDTITPLLEGKFSHEASEFPRVVYPIYRTTMSYREWLQIWVTDMVGKTSGKDAGTIFNSCRLAIRSQDVQVARFLIPHLVLNILMSGNDDDKLAIRSEIVTVLEDQATHQDGSVVDHRVLSAQTVFHLLDHMCTWIRVARRHITEKERRSRNSGSSDLEMQVMAVESMISSLDQELLATAALNCKSYARALMTIEQVIQSRSAVGTKNDQLQSYLERLHLIYAHLDEPDGMEGVSTKILSPSLEHEIREHESTGRWTSAQSCWEVRLQQSPDDVDLHIGLLKCLRNLGHYDTLRTHIRGILTRSPEWEQKLAGYHAESAWMTGDWDTVNEIVQRTKSDLPELVIARLLLSLRGHDERQIMDAFQQARCVLGASITSSGKYSYRRTYDAVINLHVVHELEMIHNTQTTISRRRLGDQGTLASLQRTKSSLRSRLEQTLPTFKTREPILSMRRIALGLRPDLTDSFKSDLGQAWLASSKIARKAGHFQTAYTSILQARQLGTPYSFIQSCKLIYTEGDALRALHELNSALRDSQVDTKMDLSEDRLDAEEQMLKAKALLLRARWTHETRRSDSNDLLSKYTEAAEVVSEWESPYFYLGAYQDELFRVSSDPRIRWVGSRARHQACKYYIKALKFGSKFVYQAMPRLLTIWLDSGADSELVEISQSKLNKSVEDAIGSLPPYQWFTAFPQIISRIGHPNTVVYSILASLVSHVLCTYPQQALWLFTVVVHSQRQERRQRGRAIIDRVKSRSARNDQTSILVNEWLLMTQEFLTMCDKDAKNCRQGEEMVVDLKTFAPLLPKMTPCSLIIPLQNSLTVTVPSAGQSKDIHKPFPLNLPAFHQFNDEVTLMSSLIRPKKFTVMGSDGIRYNLLGKPKDDMRKDARLMDFNSMINKMLKINSESRKRQLHIRTYGVIPLNEECGLIEWVNNTKGFRHILKELYEARGIQLMASDIHAIKSGTDKSVMDKPGRMKFLVEEILPQFPPVFHEWFIATFPEPSTWLACRLNYGRTLGVMSMVGFILGLGDRHGENILFDSVTGDTVHVDFNCIFDKGQYLDIPEVVPFRLTQNLVDGLGVTGVEGAYRRACEVTMQLLRDNKDSLMSVLEAFTHDPISEWETERKREERLRRRRGDPNPHVPKLSELVQRALGPIQERLSGTHTFRTENTARSSAISTPNQVERLIKEATSPLNLGSMYVGWAAWL
ncbi:uncharacterized protein EI90DRAFT_2908515 [Cantharellus anzutake]|uniref:uncharacterized protein n=1 Tax=Cantharellus anzutake TaxID=1750568 RepID=UPI001907258B|nr:uncharacterized protein EI90DRAFT_2908515 [Cantharellus anzutake]KAF8338841.1 hypothetical protein EI90DRAFT_2908515 [Cantharellus anzutake]